MIGAERQLDYAKSVQATRTASSITGNAGVQNAATGKFLAGAYDRPQRFGAYQGDITPRIVEDERPLLPGNWQPLTLQDAFAQSTRAKWVLGQNRQTGELFTVNPKENAHFGIVGATGCGKTAYTGLLLMAHALKSQFRFVILDGKMGADWSKYRNRVEYYALDETNIGEVVDQMVAQYAARQELLNTHQVNSIWELPQGMTRPRPTVFMFDEFGAVMDSLKALNKKAYDAVAANLSKLLRLSRGAGLYVVLCDQNPTKWPGTVRANMPVNVCFRLGGLIGNAISEYGLDHLDRVGHFQVGNVQYHAWPTYETIDGVLAEVDYKRPKALLTVTDVTKFAGGNIDARTRKVSLEGDTAIDSTIAPRGGFAAPSPPPTVDSDDSAIVINTPVIDSAINSTIDSGDSSNSTIKRTPLTGKPLSAKEKSLVRNTHALTGSVNETCRVLYGAWTVSRGKWVKEILADNGQVMQ